MQGTLWLLKRQERAVVVIKYCWWLTVPDGGRDRVETIETEMVKSSRKTSVVFFNGHYAYAPRPFSCAAALLVQHRPLQKDFTCEDKTRYNMTII